MGENNLLLYFKKMYCRNNLAYLKEPLRGQFLKRHLAIADG